MEGEKKGNMEEEKDGKYNNKDKNEAKEEEIK